VATNLNLDIGIGLSVPSVGLTETYSVSGNPLNIVCFSVVGRTMLHCTWRQILMMKGQKN